LFEGGNFLQERESIYPRKWFAVLRTVPERKYFLQLIFELLSADKKDSIRNLTHGTGLAGGGLFMDSKRELTLHYRVTTVQAID
jgi:hypothetical protein